jgi:hypothetical protein
MKNEQTEYLLALLSALVDAQEKRNEILKDAEIERLEKDLFLALDQRDWNNAQCELLEQKLERAYAALEVCDVPVKKQRKRIEQLEDEAIELKLQIDDLEEVVKEMERDEQYY